MCGTVCSCVHGTLSWKLGRFVRGLLYSWGAFVKVQFSCRAHLLVREMSTNLKFGKLRWSPRKIESCVCCAWWDHPLTVFRFLPLPGLLRYHLFSVHIMTSCIGLDRNPIFKMVVSVFSSMYRRPAIIVFARWLIIRCYLCLTRDALKQYFNFSLNWIHLHIIYCATVTV